MHITTLKRLMIAASKDETRPHLNGVNITRKGSELTALVTDGHRAVKEKILSEELLDVLRDGESVFFTPEIVKTLDAGLNKAGRLTPLQFKRDGNKVSCTNAAGASVSFVIDGVNFPKHVETFFDIQRASPFSIALSAELLEGLTRAMHDQKLAQMCVLTFDLADTNKAITVSCGDQGLGVLMPMRMGPSENEKTLKALRGGK